MVRRAWVCIRQDFKRGRTLNIIELAEAVKRTRIKSVKRKLWLCYQQFDNLFFETEALLATDWEIEEKKIEITESEFDAIANEVQHHYSSNTILHGLKKRLFEK